MTITFGCRLPQTPPPALRSACNRPQLCLAPPRGPTSVCCSTTPSPARTGTAPPARRRRGLCGRWWSPALRGRRARVTRAACRPHALLACSVPRQLSWRLTGASGSINHTRVLTSIVAVYHSEGHMSWRWCFERVSGRRGGGGWTGVLARSGPQIRASAKIFLGASRRKRFLRFCKGLARARGVSTKVWGGI